MIPSRWSRLGRDRRAATALEFGLIAGPMLLLIIGTVEFGRLMWTREALEMTAIEGARCMGVLDPSCASGGAYSSANTTSYIESVASAWGITLTGANMTLNPSTTTGSCSGLSASVSEVTLAYTFQTVVPGLVTALSGGTPLTGHACFPRQP